ncbi:hypothetical protein C8T65DRAFT_637760 [Cerioporus squamosus]|nr:hypothetical protein C8T65DRAFT_637760 [Cerioporus squamosus]
MSRAAATASATLTSRSDPNSSDDDHPGSFLGSGGSTLILAFLALGLFLAGILVMISMRRYVVAGRRRIRTWQVAGERGWEWDEAPGGPATTGGMSVMVRRRRDFGKQPELWDFRVEETEDLGWDSIQPVAAKLVYEDEILPSPRRPGDDPLRSAASSEIRSDPSSTRPGFMHPFRVGWHDFATQLPTRRRPQPHPHPSASSASGPSTPQAVDRIAGEAAPSVSSPFPRAHCVRILAAITMPTEQPCADGVPLYALGITDVPWIGYTPEDPPPGPASRRDN